MAKAQFNKNQRVWVEAVGAWSVVERIVPVWSKGFDEPVRIGYDVGLGREFTAQELSAETPTAPGSEAEPAGDRNWRVLRARNRWQPPEACAHHPQPGSFPVVVTDPNDWGGWRTPGAEYDRDPPAIERQARLIAAAPRLMRLARDLAELVAESPDEVPHELLAAAKRAQVILRDIGDGA